MGTQTRTQSAEDRLNLTLASLHLMAPDEAGLVVQRLLEEIHAVRLAG